MLEYRIHEREPPVIYMVGRKKQHDTIYAHIYVCLHKSSFEFTLVKVATHPDQTNHVIYIYMRVVLYSFIYKPSLGRPCAKLARRLRDSGFWINQCLRYHELGHTAQEEKKKQQEKKTNKEKEKKQEETKRKKTQDRKGKEKQRHEKK